MVAGTGTTQPPTLRLRSAQRCAHHSLPETSIPQLATRVKTFTEAMHEWAKDNGSTLLMGWFLETNLRQYNSMIVAAWNVIYTKDTKAEGKPTQFCADHEWLGVSPVDANR